MVCAVCLYMLVMTLFCKALRLKVFNLSTYHICSEIKDFKQINHYTYVTREQHMVLMKDLTCQLFLPA